MGNIINNIRIIKDFPKKGINFYDISSLLAKPKIFKKTIELMIKKASKVNATAIAGIDSRGFLFASIVAYKLNLKLIIIRKKGKLPGKVFKSSYSLEYGKNTLEIQKAFLKPHDRVILIDDIFATSGTLNSSCKLIEKTKANVVCAIVLLELKFLNGRKKFKYKLNSLEEIST